MKIRLRYKIILVTLLAGVPAGFLLSSCSGKASSAAQQQKGVKYVCPMHPNYVSEKPGDCPICNMKLVPQAPAEGAQTPSTSTAAAGAQLPKKKKIMYRSTMNPNEVSDHPGKDSMGMEMEAFEVDENAQKPAVEGLATVTIPQDKQQLLGVRTDKVCYRNLSKVVTTTGKVAYDPDLYYAQQEYLSSLKTYNEAKASSDPVVVENAKSLLDASKFKLRLMGFGEAQLKTLAEQGVADRSLLLNEDVQHVWIYAAVFQNDIDFVKVGQSVTITAPSLINRKLRGTVVALDPVLNQQTRDIRARIITENVDGLLKPEAYVNVEIRSPLGSRLTVPAAAVMDTGTKQVVFIDKGNGVFEPRAVRLGERSDDYYVVASGLANGEKVVTNANFLIDSESQLKAAASQSGGGHQH